MININSQLVMQLKCLISSFFSNILADVPNIYLRGLSMIVLTSSTSLDWLLASLLKGRWQLTQMQTLSRTNCLSRLLTIPVRSGRLTCKFDGRCDRIPNCPYMHYKEDFPPLQGKRNPTMRMTQHQSFSIVYLSDQLVDIFLAGLNRSK